MHCYLTLVISTKSAVTDPCKRRTLSFAEQEECAQEFREKCRMWLITAVAKKAYLLRLFSSTQSRLTLAINTPEDELANGLS